MWAVDLSVIGAGIPHAWRGWAADSGDAKTKAMDDARRTWHGRSFVVRSVMQVGT